MIGKSQADLLSTILSTLGYAVKYLEPGKFQGFLPCKFGWAKQFADCLGGVLGDYCQNIRIHWSARVHQTPTDPAAIRRQVQLETREYEADHRVRWAKNLMSNLALWEVSQPAVSRSACLGSLQ